MGHQFAGHWYPHFTVGVEINGRLRSLYYKLPFTNISAFYSFNKKLSPEQIKEFENKDNFTITWMQNEYGDTWYPSNVGWFSRAKLGEYCDDAIKNNYDLCRDANLEISVFCGNKEGLGFCLLTFDIYTFFDTFLNGSAVIYPFIKHSNSKIPQNEGGYTFVLDISGDERKN